MLDNMARIRKAATVILGSWVVLGVATACAGTPMSSNSATTPVSSKYDALQTSSSETQASSVDPDWDVLGRIYKKVLSEEPQARVNRISTGLRKGVVSAEIVIGTKFKEFIVTPEGFVQRSEEPSTVPLGETFSASDLAVIRNNIAGIRQDAHRYAESNGLRVDKITDYKGSFHSVPGSTFSYDKPVVEFSLGDELLTRPSGSVPRQYRIYDARSGKLVWQAGPEDTDVVFNFLED